MYIFLLYSFFIKNIKNDFYIFKLVYYTSLLYK